MNVFRHTCLYVRYIVIIREHFRCMLMKALRYKPTKLYDVTALSVVNRTDFSGFPSYLY